MEFNANSKKAYIPVEPDIYDKLNYDYDLIVSCLEYIRNEIPDILQIDNSVIEVFLVSFYNFLGQHYPAIGIRIKSNSTEKINLEYFEIEEKVEIWLANLGIENLKEKAKTIESIDWKTLEKIKQYPELP